MQPAARAAGLDFNDADGECLSLDSVVYKCKEAPKCKRVYGNFALTIYQICGRMIMHENLNAMVSAPVGWDDALVH